MPNNIKITIIGAGSAQFSAEIVRDLCRNPGFYGSKIVFMDVDEKRLNTVTVLAERLARELNAKLSFEKTTDRKIALRGADFVINTAQVGGHSWVEAQRTMAENHGYYRGAGLHYIVQAVFFLDLAKDMELICPNAWLIQCANPVFEGCTLITRETGIKVLGLCHGHYSYQNIIKILGLDPKYVKVNTLGFNHWIWMTDFTYKGEDAYPLLDEWIEKKAEQYWSEDNWSCDGFQMSPAAIHQYKLYGLMPIGDTVRKAGWWYHPDLETKKQWFGIQGGYDSEIGWQLYLDEMKENMEKIERVAWDENIPVTNTFKPEESEEPIVNIINSLINDIPCEFPVNIPNKGSIIKGFPEDLVIECLGIVSGEGIKPTISSHLPNKLITGAMLPRWAKAETFVEAIRAGDRNLLLIYLLEYERSQKLQQAESLLDEWFADSRNTRLKELFYKG